MRLAARALLLLAVWGALAAPPALAQREPVLVPAVSQSLIEVRQGFTGARLLRFQRVRTHPVGFRLMLRTTPPGLGGRCIPA